MHTLLKTVESNRSYLKWVDVERSHWPRVLVTLSNDDVALPGNDVCRVVQDDIAVLSSGDKDTGWVILGIHSVGTPHQLVIPVERKNTHVIHGNTGKDKQHEFGEELVPPVRGGEAST